MNLMLLLVTKTQGATDEKAGRRGKSESRSSEGDEEEGSADAKATKNQRYSSEEVADGEG